MKYIIETLFSIILAIGITIGSVLLSLFTSQIIIDKKMKSNKFLEKIDKEQLEHFINQNYLEVISKNRENYKIENSGDLDYYYLEDIVADIDSICRCILMSDKKINRTKEETLDKEFINFVKKINNKEINNIYKEMQNIKKIAFKYYDENGCLKK